MPDAKVLIQGTGWVLALILYIRLSLTPAPPDRMDELQALRDANDSLKQLNVGLESDYQMLLAEEDSMLVFLQNQKNRIVELKDERNEQMDRVLDLDHNELVRFFAEYSLPSREPNTQDSRH